MISFIVIGKNEGWKLSLCLESILKTIDDNAIENFEIIYVDSKSTDDSIKRAKSYKIVNIYSITGSCNAAIARNIGASMSKGEVLFFIDGDIELEPGFLKEVYHSTKGELKHNCITGYTDNMHYDDLWDFIGRSPEGYGPDMPMKESKRPLSGGIFLIKRDVWEKVGGMRTKFLKNQDLDLALRLSKIKEPIIRVPHLMGLHHTIDYRNEKRMWNILGSGYLLYPAVTFRDHLLSFASLKYTFRSKYTALLLFAALVLIFFNTFLSAILIIAYLILLAGKVMSNTLRTSVKSISKINYFFSRIMFQFMADIVFLFGLFLFFPKEKEVLYERVS